MEFACQFAWDPVLKKFRGGGGGVGPVLKKPFMYVCEMALNMVLQYVFE